MPGNPTEDDIAAAKHLLLDLLLADFPWGGESDRANYLAALFTPVLRPLTGLSPFYAIDAPERGSGKTLLGVDIPWAVHGARSLPFPGSNEEMRKVILSALRGDSTQPVVCFDNVAAPATVNSAALAMVLTGAEYTDRVLGGSKVVELENDRLWICTGTNIRLGGDIPQRTVRVEPNYDQPRPDLRSGFVVQYITAPERLGKDPDQVTEAEVKQYGGDLDVWLTEHAADVLHALLVLARAWVIAGMPQSGHLFRNYTRWAQVCGGLLEFHGIGDGFLANRDQVPDTDAEVWGPFLAQWRKIFPRPVKVRDLLEEARLEDVMPIERDGARSVNEDDLWGPPSPPNRNCRSWAVS